LQPHARACHRNARRLHRPPRRGELRGHVICRGARVSGRRYRRRPGIPSLHDADHARVTYELQTKCLGTGTGGDESRTEDARYHHAVRDSRRPSPAQNPWRARRIPHRRSIPAGIAMSSERRGRLQRLLSDRGADGALVTNPVNIRYLSGFTGSNGALLVDVDGPVRLITDGRYQDQAAAEAPDVDVIIDRELLCACARYMTGTWAVETNHLTVDEYRQLPSGTAGLDGAVESLRAIKDPGECQLLSRACQMSTRALDGLLESGLEGR